MEEKLSRLENQMKRLITDFRDAREKNEELRRQNDQLLNELLEKNRQLEVFEERDSVLMEAQAQKKRLEERTHNPLKQWKLSTTDVEAQQKWHEFTRYKEKMFKRTHRDFSPWVIVKGNDKQKARLESIRYVLSQITYTGKATKGVSFHCDPNTLEVYSPPMDTQ